jgi:hypothetical protein
VSLVLGWRPTDDGSNLEDECGWVDRAWMRGGGRGTGEMSP